jgi:hypothetical protein
MASPQMTPASPLEKAAESLRLAQEHARAADSEYRLRREKSKAQWREREAEVRSKLVRLHREEVLSSSGRSTRSSSVTSSMGSSPRSRHQARTSTPTWPAVRHSAMPRTLSEDSSTSSPSLAPRQLFTSQPHMQPGEQAHVRAAQAGSDQPDSPREWVPDELQHEEEVFETSQLEPSTDEPAMQPDGRPPFRHLSALTSPLMTPLGRVSPVTSPLSTPRPPLSPAQSSVGSSAGRPTSRVRVLRSSALTSVYQEANHEVASRLVQDGVYDGFRAAAEHWKQEISADAEALQRKLVAEMEEQARLHEQSIAHHAAACTDVLQSSERNSPRIQPTGGIPAAHTQSQMVEGREGVEAPESTHCARPLAIEGAPEMMRDAAYPQLDNEGSAALSMTAPPLPKIPKKAPNGGATQMPKPAIAVPAQPTSFTTRVLQHATQPTPGNTRAWEADVSAYARPPPPGTQLHVRTRHHFEHRKRVSPRPTEIGFLNRSPRQVKGPVSQPMPAAAASTPVRARETAPRPREPLETAGLVLMVGGSTALLAIVFRQSLSASLSQVREAVQAGALALRENVAVGARNSMELALSAQRWAQQEVPVLAQSWLVTAHTRISPLIQLSRGYLSYAGLVVTMTDGRLHARWGL